MRFYAWMGSGEIVELQEKESISGALDEADNLPDEYNWVFSENSLQEFVANARSVLNQSIDKRVMETIRQGDPALYAKMTEAMAANRAKP